LFSGYQKANHTGEKEQDRTKEKPNHTTYGKRARADCGRLIYLMNAIDAREE